MFAWKAEIASHRLEITERPRLLVTSVNTIPATFFDDLRDAPTSVLLLDYDGTLAPFQTERHRAYPYPQVVPLLETILDTGRSRVVIVTGRSIADVRPLLNPLRAVEVWGSHGIEHLSADGLYSQSKIPPDTVAALSDAAARLTAAGLAGRTEIKPGGVAVHWRGLSEAETQETYTATHQCLRPFTHHPGLKLLEFDGGVELRVAHPHKGDAVTAILSGCDPDTPVAYLGDDHTDEAAFRALNSRGITVLVRHEYRRTNAQFWIQPPNELIHFLQQWSHCLS